MSGGFHLSVDNSLRVRWGWSTTSMLSERIVGPDESRSASDLSLALPTSFTYALSIPHRTRFRSQGHRMLVPQKNAFLILAALACGAVLIMISVASCGALLN
jgi:hypothetical protein